MQDEIKTRGPGPVMERQGWIRDNHGHQHEVALMGREEAIRALAYRLEAVPIGPHLTPGERVVMTEIKELGRRLEKP
jgi:hypothetical protein